MDSSIVTAFIATGSSLAALYLGTHTEMIKERLKRKQKREDEEEMKISKLNAELFIHMCTIRDVSRNQIAKFTQLQEKIDSSDDSPSREELSSLFHSIRSTISTHTDVVLEVAPICPAVRDAWFHFDILRTQYMDEVDGCARGGEWRASELGLLLDAVKAARSDLVEELKAAAKTLGYSLLVRHVDVDDQHAP
ncbi:hypothetical protein AB0937_18175 [Streptomyces sp. NPDC047880]|uniref:hypothetical protein n=1 Tax=Streptomyces sp. NPDC047880 TaxID=3155626 RepID=UPI0034524C3B